MAVFDSPGGGRQDDPGPEGQPLGGLRAADPGLQLGPLVVGQRQRLAAAAWGTSGGNPTEAPPEAQEEDKRIYNSGH